MLAMTLRREKLSPTGLLGRMVTNTWFDCYTLERRPDDPDHPCIPAGEYQVIVAPTNNPRLWVPEELRGLPHVLEVPGRTGILIHAGNHASDTEGCILVGLTDGDDSIWRSRDAVRALVREIWTHGPARLSVGPPPDEAQPQTAA